MSTELQENSGWAPDWQVRVRVWVEREGLAVLGDGRSELLAAIDRTRSITAAAKSLGISYRHAWMTVKAINDAAVDPLVTAAVGGVKGGGAQLTPRGKLSLQVFEQISEQVRLAAGGVLRKVVGPASDAVHLAAAISLQELVGQVLAEYALRQPRIQVRAVFGASNELVDHILSGAPCDVFISADPVHLERLAAMELLRNESRRVLASNHLVVLGRSELVGEVRKPRDLVSKQVARVALAEASVPLGKCSKHWLDGLGLYDRVSAKSIRVDNSRGILAALAAGHADVGVAFASDAAKAGESETLMAVDSADASLEYSAAALKGSSRESDALALLDFFSSPPGQSAARRCGLLPASAVDEVHQRDAELKGV